MKKNNIGKEIFALSLIGTLSLSHPHLAKASANFNQTVVTSQDIPTVTAITNVNLRAGANISSQKVGTLLRGQSLRLYEQYGDWYKVGYNNTFVYVNKNYVVQTSQTQMMSPSIKTIRLDKSMALYSDESCTYLIGTIPANTYVNVYLDNPYTYYVCYNNKTGYISKNYKNNYNNNYNYNYYQQPVYNYDTPVYYNNTPTYYDNNVPVYTQNNYYGPVENNYYYYDDVTYNYDNNKVLVRK